MANSLCFTSVCSFSAPSKPGTIINDYIQRKVLRVNEVFKSSRDVKFQSFVAKAADKDQSTQSKSIVCRDCEANGSQSTGVNAIDHFNGRFEAGGLCWLCSCAISYFRHHSESILIPQFIGLKDGKVLAISVSI